MSLPPEAKMFPSVLSEDARNMAKETPFRILVVEDLEECRRDAIRKLGYLGYTCDIAVNGRQAFEMLENNQYDIVFMDLHMPEMTGLQASEKITKRWTPAERPYIVALTASTDHAEWMSCLKIGMDSYMRKPLQSVELLKLMNIIKKSKEVAKKKMEEKLAQMKMGEEQARMS